MTHKIVPGKGTTMERKGSLIFCILDRFLDLKNKGKHERQLTSFLPQKSNFLIVSSTYLGNKLASTWHFCTGFIGLAATKGLTLWSGKPCLAQARWKEQKSVQIPIFALFYNTVFGGGESLQKWHHCFWRKERKKKGDDSAKKEITILGWVWENIFKYLPFLTTFLDNSIYLNTTYM